MGTVVIACYRPKKGKARALAALVRRHMKVLRKERLVTSRPSIAMRAKDGTFIEVFEWASWKAVEKAHSNPAVQRLWKAFGEACDYVPISRLAEGKSSFAHFDPF